MTMGLTHNELVKIVTEAMEIKLGADNKYAVSFERSRIGEVKTFIEVEPNKQEKGEK